MWPFSSLPFLSSRSKRIKGSRRRRQGAPSQAKYRLFLEQLEDRTLPSTVTWIGPASGGDWDTPANWSTNTVPGVSTYPVSNGTLDDVVIPANVSLTHSQNYAETINSLTTGSGDVLTVSGGSLMINTASTINGNLSVYGGTFGGSADL